MKPVINPVRHVKFSGIDVVASPVEALCNFIDVAGIEGKFACFCYEVDRINVKTTLAVYWLC